MPNVLLAACLPCLPYEEGRPLTLPTVTSHLRVPEATATAMITARVTTVMARVMTIRTAMVGRQNALLAVYLSSLWSEGVLALKLPISTNPPRVTTGVTMAATAVMMVTAIVDTRLLTGER